MHISYVFNYTEALWKHEMYLVGLLLFFFLLKPEKRVVSEDSVS